VARLTDFCLFFQKEALPAMQQGTNRPGEQRENKMGVMPVNKLILNMSLPIMISMLVQALYNVVDSVFVSRISENALTAVSLAFPVQNLMIRCGVGTGVGINALLSRSLGEKNYRRAGSTAGNGIFLAILSYRGVRGPGRDAGPASSTPRRCT
jgi:Na+-driven multidrug efflux pump